METRLEHVEDTELLDITVPLYKLASSPTNPRTSFPADTMAELTASVKEHGVIQPLLLRAWPEHYAYTGDKPVYEIVAGERRFRAAIAAGLIDVPYLLRDLTDEQVVQIQIIENLQREDLHPLEEAEGYQKMMRDHEYSAEDLAEKIGKSRSYIFGRLKLLDLDEDSRRMFRGGILNASTALLVARIPSDTLRAKAIKEITTPNHTGEGMSVRQAQECLQNRYMLQLVQAKFPIDDATLQGGSCVDCPKRTGNAADLFPEVKSSDVCTDPDCFAAKRQGHFDRQVKEAKENGGTVITGDDAREIAPFGTHHQWTSLRGYIREDQLDQVCEEDEHQRTYREIIGDSVKPTMVEDHVTSTLTACIPNTVLADKLREAGITTSDERNDQASRERQLVIEAEQAEARIEKPYRERLFETIRAQVIDLTTDGIPAIPYDAAMAIFRRAIRWVAVSVGEFGDLERVARLWIPEDEVAQADNVEGGIEELFYTRMDVMSDGEVWRALVDLLVIGDVVANPWQLKQPAPDLAAVSNALSIDRDEIRKNVADELEKANEEAKKPPPATSAEAFSPTEAAQAGESARDENSGLAVGDRVRIRNDIATGTAAWRRKVSGREGVIEAVDGACLDVRVGDGKSGLVKGLVWNEVEKIEPAIEAAQASDQIADEKVTNETPFGAGECIGVFEIGGHTDPIETNETPTGTGDGESSGEADVIETNEKPADAARGFSPYRHPDAPTLTWSGKGRKPQWVTEYLAIKGNTLDGLKVAA